MESLIAAVPLRPRKRAKAESKTLRYNYINAGIFLSGLSVFSQLYIFQPLLPILCKDFDISPAQSSWAVSASTLGVGIGLFILSFKADQISRTQLMCASMLTSSFLTICTAFVHHFPLLVFISVLKGIVLAGVTGVALAYLSEEISASAIGVAISLYLSGNAIGGMAGRIEATLLAGWLNWRWAVGLIGVLSFVLGLFFCKLLPASRHFIPARAHWRTKWSHIHQFSRHPQMLRYYLSAALLMGCFVSVYNYLGFRLEAAPFSLPHYIIASIFLMYIIGVGGTLLAGKWSNRIAPQQLLRLFMLSLTTGLLLLLSNYILLVTLGLGIITFSFFAAHTMTSRIITQIAPHSKSTATALYWLFYYAGSSMIGSASGSLLSAGGWKAFIPALIVLSVIVQILVKPKTTPAVV